MTKETIVIAKPAAKSAPAKTAKTKAPTVAQMAAAVGITPEVAAKTIAKSKAAPAKKAERKPDANPVIEKMLQGLEAKKDAKAGAKKPETAATTAPKKSAITAKDAVAVPLNAKKLKKGSPVFLIQEAARPGGGRALFAHTHAALTVLGLLDAARPAVPKSTLLTVMGQRAVVYHLKQANFEDAPDHGIRLSQSGYNKFRERAVAGQVDHKMANGFMDLFTEGKVDDTGIAKGNVWQTQF